jgi:hypothetical protein
VVPEAPQVAGSVGVVDYQLVVEVSRRSENKEKMRGLVLHIIEEGLLLSINKLVSWFTVIDCIACIVYCKARIRITLMTSTGW